MWVSAGFLPDTFWDQTPATFGAAMRGVRARLEREADDLVRLAHQTAVFSRMDKLSGDVRRYLPKRGAPVRQSPRDMLAVLRSLQAGGAPMTIRKREG